MLRILAVFLLGISSVLIFAGILRPVYDIAVSQSWTEAPIETEWPDSACMDSDEHFGFPGGIYAQYGVGDASHVSLAFVDANTYLSEDAIREDLCTRREAFISVEEGRAVLSRSLPVRAFDPYGLFLLVPVSFLWRWGKTGSGPRSSTWFLVLGTIGALSALHFLTRQLHGSGVWVWLVSLAVLLQATRRGQLRDLFLHRHFLGAFLIALIPLATYFHDHNVLPDWQSTIVWQLLTCFVIGAATVGVLIQDREPSKEASG